MIYIEFQNENQAKRVSELLYSLFSPDGVGTIYLFGWIKHPTQDKTVGMVNENEEVPVYHKPNLDTILDEIGTELGAISNQTELTSLGQYIQSVDRLVVGNIVPQYYLENQITKADLYTLGYLTEE